MTIDENAIALLLGEVATSTGLGAAHVVHGGQEVTVCRTTTMATGTTGEVVRKVVGPVVYSGLKAFFAACREKNTDLKPA